MNGRVSLVEEPAAGVSLHSGKAKMAMDPVIRVARQSAGRHLLRPLVPFAVMSASLRRPASRQHGAL